MRGPTRVVFLPVAHDDVVDVSGMEGHDSVHIVGFKPGPSRSRAGHLVLLVHEGTSPQRNHAFGGSRYVDVTVPRAAAPKKLRGPRSKS